MSKHLDRMTEELAELEGKSARLVAFLATDTFAELADVDQSLLFEQHRAMAVYAACLVARLGRAGR